MTSVEDKLSALSLRDIEVLRAVSSGKSDPKMIAESLGIETVSVISTAEGLSLMDLIRVEKMVDELYSLTEEGSRYAIDGLPERRLLRAMGDGLPLSEIDDPSLKIGIGWLRKKGWATIDKGMVRPAGTATTGEDEAVLDLLKEGPQSGEGLDRGALDQLKSRGLVESSRSKRWRFETTDLGKKMASSIEKTALFTGDALAAKEVGQITPAMIKAGIWEGSNLLYSGERFQVRRYDVSLPAERIYPGKKHPYQRIIDGMREIMLEMGFTEIRGEIIQSSYWNFDALFQPQDHPAREMQDTFYLESTALIPDYTKVLEMHERGGNVGSSGWGGRWDPELARREVLRTHTTAITIKYLADNPDPPVKAFCIDRAYRRETIDPTHTPEFEQLEGVIMDEGVTFRNLLGILRQFYSKMGFENVRFRPAYYPYTEPSVDPEVYIEGLGWVELGGAGVFRREVTAPFGIEHPVLAWGLGASRVAMLNLGLKDLRLLYQSDIGWLRDTPLSLRVH